jgi:hypothetical protein
MPVKKIFICKICKEFVGIEYTGVGSSLWLDIPVGSSIYRHEKHSSETEYVFDHIEIK